MLKGVSFPAMWLWLLLLALGAVSASATTYYGCFICKYRPVVGIGATCDQVGDGQNGDGWKCDEVNDLPWPDGPSCTLSGGPCLNSNAGGGGSGTGGSTTCQTSGFCPAECFSCGGGFGRPAN
jgi:hypothetical protein